MGQDDVYNHLVRNGLSTARQVASALDVSDTSANSCLKKLKYRGDVDYKSMMFHDRFGGKKMVRVWFVKK